MAFNFGMFGSTAPGLFDGAFTPNPFMSGGQGVQAPALTGVPSGSFSSVMGQSQSAAQQAMNQNQSTAQRLAQQGASQNQGSSQPATQAPAAPQQGGAPLGGANFGQITVNPNPLGPVSAPTANIQPFSFPDITNTVPDLSSVTPDVSAGSSSGLASIGDDLDDFADLFA
jgi:hypothetical protein